MILLQRLIKSLPMMRLSMPFLKFTAPLLLLGLAIGVSWWLIAHKAELDKTTIKTVKHQIPTVSVVMAEAQTLRMDVRSQGVIAPLTEIALVPEVSGKVVVAHSAFAAGGYFKKGELLIAIDSHDYEFAVTRAKAAVAEAYKELLREREEAQQAESEWQALGSGKPTDYVLHKPHVQERQAKLDAARADLEAARLQVARCRLSAPFNGWVRDKRVSAGQYLSAGAEVAQIYADDSAEVRLPVASDQVEFLALPSPDAPGRFWPEVTLTVRFGNQEQHWQGRLVRTAGDLDENNGMLNAIAVIPDAFKSQPGRLPLLPGLFVHASIEGIERSDLVSLPKSALHGGHEVYSVDKEGRLRLHNIDILRNDKDRIIVNRGIAAGERILIEGVDLPVAGMRVQVRPAAASQVSMVSVKTDE